MTSRSPTISIDTARRQATEQGHSLADELTVLLVHGVVHLLGYDHIDPSDRRFMRSKERDVLAALLEEGAAPNGLIDRGIEG